MDFRIFTEPQQGATYSDLLRVARTTQDAGYDAFFRSDHWVAMGDDGGEGGGLPGPTDAWMTLAALGRETERIRLGTLVTSATFRLPGPLAVAVAQADEMSGGRIELGLGTGWFEAEHTAYGIPFPPLRERFEILTEQLEILTGMWATPPGTQFTHRGTHYTLVDSPALPRPAQDAPPVIVGGMGRAKTPALAARFASEFNVPFQAPDAVAEQFGRVRDACRAADRDPADLTYSVAQMLCLGRDDAEVARRAHAVGRDVAEVRANCLAGTPAEVVDRLGTWSEQTGTTRVYLQILDLSDLDHLEDFASLVVPELS